MHELSRHVIHISETLKVASSSLVEMTNAHHSFSTLFPLGARGDGQSEASQQIRKELQLSSNLLSNLQSRAQAFVDRLQNEIQLV